MVNLIPFLTVFLLVIVHQGLSQVSYVEKQNHAEFEDILTEKQMKETNDLFWSWRSEASGKKALRLEDETGRYIVEFNICVQPVGAGTNVSLQLENIRYSNDGPTDILQVSLNNQVFGRFNTIAKRGGGHEWNVFHNSGLLGFPQILTQGQHVLHVTALTDKYGVELDWISLNAVNQDPDTPLFCGGKLIIISQLSYVEKQNHAEFEDILTEKQMKETNDLFWSWRSEASGKKALRLVDETGRYIVEFNICVQPVGAGTNVSLQLENIRYSNDGPTDILQVSLNNQVFGRFNTFAKWGDGHEWNVFHNSGLLGFPQILTQGQHVLHVTARTDKYGVELDWISLNAVNQDPDTPLFCGGKLIILQ